MDRYVNILYRISRFLAGVPPETLGPLILAVFVQPWLLAATIFVLKYVGGLILGGVVAWYLKALFEVHIWSKISPEHRDALLKLRDSFRPGADRRSKDESIREEDPILKHRGRHPHE